jgi:hypothetical protein
MSDDWISYPAADEWLAARYRLSVGAAQSARIIAVRSGNVRQRARFANFDKPIEVSPAGPRLWAEALFCHDHELNREDLVWQIERQLGKPPRIVPSGTRGKPVAEATIRDSVNKYLRKKTDEPNMDYAWEFVAAQFPDTTGLRDRTREIYRELTGHRGRGRRRNSRNKSPE